MSVLLGALLSAAQRRATHLYALGNGAPRWVAGHSAGAGSQAKNADHLYLLAEDSGPAQRTWVTDVAYDLTKVSAVEVEWQNDGSGSGSRADLVASTSKTASTSTYDLRFRRSGGHARRFDVLDVSSLSGSYFIRVHANDSLDNGANRSEVRAYRVRMLR